MPRHTIWTDAMDAVLRRYYAAKGGEACAERLGLTVDRVWARAAKLGLRHQRAPAWTQREDELMRSHYPAGGPKACLRLLPGRSDTAIENRANRLGLYYRKRWAGGGPPGIVCDHRALAAALGMATREPESLAVLPARVITRM